MNDNELVASVSDELFWDPKVDSEAIAVTADGGIVTVRGTVGSFREKREVKKAAERVWGVVSVTNQLDVELMTSRLGMVENSITTRKAKATAQNPRPCWRRVPVVGSGERGMTTMMRPPVIVRNAHPR